MKTIETTFVYFVKRRETRMGQKFKSMNIFGL